MRDSQELHKTIIRDIVSLNEDGSIETSPCILCDNDELAPLFSKKLTGRIKNVDCPEKNKIIIEIYKE